MGDMVDRVDEETLAARTQLKTWQITMSVSFIFVRHSTPQGLPLPKLNMNKLSWAINFKLMTK